MTVGFVAIYYRHTGDYDKFVSCVQRAAEVMRPTPGSVSAECWATPTGEAVIAIARRGSEAAQASSLAIARAAGIDLDHDKRDGRRRIIIRLRELR